MKWTSANLPWHWKLLCGLTKTVKTIKTCKCRWVDAVTRWYADIFLFDNFCERQKVRDYQRSTKRKMNNRRLFVLRDHLQLSSTAAQCKQTEKVISVKEIKNIIIATTAGSYDTGPKINQDACVFLKDCLCLCDGHGQLGELVSDIVTKAITTNCRLEKYANDHAKLAERAQEEIRQNLAAEYSGSTGVWAVLSVDKTTLTVCNVGDSRCIVVDEAWNILFETKDHKPDEPDELERLTKAGGRVTKRPGGVARIAGLALSRAFGDFAATPHGVVATPDVTHLFLENKNAAFVMLVSDGVIDAMTSIQAVKFLQEQRLAGEELSMALIKLIKACEEQWAVDTEGEYCDDITCAIWLL
jgi:serine/threonine protein phosphatase PrpC